MPRSSSDVPAFMAARKSKGALAWTEFFADVAEWVWHRDPPSRPYRFDIAASPIALPMESENLAGDRAAFAWVGLTEGDRGARGVGDRGRPDRPVNVEAWDWQGRFPWRWPTWFGCE
jgi:hypothetical protein